MNVNKFKDSNKASEACANYILELVESKPESSVCYATGNSVIELYGKLVENSKNNNISFKDTTAIQLDEYYSILDNEELYMSNITKKLSYDLGIDSSNVITHQVTNDEGGDLGHYRSKIDKPIDVMILGIGLNGHLAYNEPGSQLVDYQIIDLDNTSINKTLGYGFKTGDKLPNKGITIGLKTILAANKIVLIAIGEQKQDVMKELLTYKQFDSCFPASVLCEHSNVEVFTDLEL